MPATRPDDAAPLIVSALLDDAAQDDLDARRRRFFPPRRHVVGAHLTLFHALPGEREDDVAASLEEACSGAPLSAEIGTPFLLGRGVAHPVEAPGLVELREDVARRWWSELSSQDRARWSPHVTVQNKVDPATARRTLESLADFRPYPARVEGLALWRYQGGPWEAAGRFLLTGGA